MPLLYTACKSDQLAICFVRVPHNHISREPLSFTDTEGDKMHPIYSNTVHTRSLFKPFRQIGFGDGMLYSGVVMTGLRVFPN
jgi:hypothetical protein